MSSVIFAEANTMSTSLPLLRALLQLPGFRQIRERFRVLSTVRRISPHRKVCDVVHRSFFHGLHGGSTVAKAVMNTTGQGRFSPSSFREIPSRPIRAF
jgi:hypothetical protein